MEIKRFFMGLGSKNCVKIVVNSITDPGVLFNIGNVVVSAQQSPVAACFNTAVAGICLITRTISELKEAGIKFEPKNFLAQKFNQLSENKGLALIVSGGLTLLSAAAYAGQTALNNGSSYGKVGMLTCFGLVHSFRGVATGLKNRFARATLDSSAFVAAASGYLFANPDLPLPIKLSYGTVAALSVWMAFKGQSAKGLKQPDLYFAATSISSACVTSSPSVAFGFATWAAAYLSIDAMRKSEGVFDCIADLPRAVKASFLRLNKD